MNLPDHINPIAVDDALLNIGMTINEIRALTSDPSPQVIRTVEELEALDPYDVIAYKSQEGYDLVRTAYDATIGDADYTLPVVAVCSNNTTMSALRTLNQEEE